MPNSRRTVRRVNVNTDHGVDEQLWPVNVALVVLGGFAVGTSLAYQSFDSPHWYSNATTYVIGIPLTIILMLAAIRFIDNRWLRRSMQLALVMSGIVHIFLLIASVESDVFTKLVVNSEDSTVPQDRRVPQVVAEYHPDLLMPENQQEQRDFEKPVETKVPDPAPVPPLEKPETKDTPTLAKSQPVPVPEPEKTLQPSLTKQTKPEESAPREAAELSQLSRQTRVQQITPSAQVADATQPSSTGMKATPTLEAKAVNARTTPVATNNATKTSTEVETPTATASAVPKKTTDVAVQPDAIATPTMKRQTNQPQLTPHAQVAAADTPSVARKSSDAELTPQNTTTDRRVTASSVRDVKTPELTAEVATNVPRVEKRTLENAPRETLAEAPQPVTAKQARASLQASAAVAAPQSPAPPTASSEVSLPGPTSTAVSRAAPSTVADRDLNRDASTPNTANTSQIAARNTKANAPPSPALPETNSDTAPRSAARSVVTNNAATSTVAVNAETPQSSVQGAANSIAATNTPVSRQSTTNNNAATKVQASLDTPHVGAGSTSLGGGASRTNLAAVPTLDAERPPSASPQRATKASAVAASPRNVDAPSNAANATPGNPENTTVAAARLAVNRSQAGMAGVGNSPNLDRGTAAPDSPALVASSAARRQEATSHGPADSALTPSTLSTRAQSRVAAETPSTTFIAQTNPGGTEGTASTVQELAASSGAALQQATGKATSGEMSAARGSTDIDTGNMMIVAEGGRSRAAGGGQPELSFDPRQGKLSRQTSAGEQPGSLAVEKVAAAATAPQGTGGGGPPLLDDKNNLATRGEPGASGALGGPSAAREAGNLAEAGTAPQLADVVAGAAGGKLSTSEMMTDDETEEEKKKRLARSRGAGAAQLATSVTTPASVVSVSQGAGTGAGSLETGAAGPANTYTTRVATQGGAPASGKLPEVGDATPNASGNGASGIALSRIELGASVAGEITATGGGTGTPTRSATGKGFTASTQAETIQLAGGPMSSGEEGGLNLQTPGITKTNTTGGIAAAPRTGAIGAAAGAELVDAATPGNVGPVAGMRNVAVNENTSPELTSGTATGAVARQVSSNHVATPDAAAIALPESSAPAQAQADFDHGTGNMRVARTQTSGGGGLRIHIDAPEGSGGLGSRPTLASGLNSRLAQPDSVDLNASPTRFVGRRSGGIPAVSLASVVPTESFRKRAEGRRGGGRLPPQTEAAVERGLAFLARHQQPDGSWRLQGMELNPENDPQMVSDSAATAMALLAFQGAGYNHREHRYATVVRNGLDFLVRNQQENGDLFVPLDDESNKSIWLYSHALASLALCEAYGMTQDPALKDPAQRAVDFILAGQSKDRGGWRYSPGVGTDTSVTGAMLVALRSAELAELKVPEAAYLRVSKWLDTAQASPSQSHLYRYNPYAPDTDAQRHGRVAGPTMTALGLLMRLYLGWERNNPNMIQGAEYLKQNLPELGTSTDIKRDTYYWYYATQVMYHMGGDYWKQWNQKLHAMLTESQVKDGPLAGSWNPRTPLPDRWAPHGGRLYVTALNLLSLEVQYRHLPTYEDTAK